MHYYLCKKKRKKIKASRNFHYALLKMEIFFPISSRGNIKRVPRITHTFATELKKLEKFVNRNQSKETHRPFDRTHFLDSKKKNKKRKEKLAELSN